MKLENIRRDYKKHKLSKTDVAGNPIIQLEKWLAEAISARVNEATAMVLSTIDENRFPESRVVLLKNLDKTGLTFFTNYNSCKSKAIDLNNRVSLLFFWPELERQVRIKGKAQKTSGKFSDEYFYSRPRESQISAVVSEQSKPIESRAYLENEIQKFIKKYEGKKISRPGHWGGYFVQAEYFEFWQGRPNRLHDRIVFKKVDNNWNIERLSP